MVIESNELNLLLVNDGEQGIPGPKGDGNYIWIKYTKLSDISNLTKDDISDDSTDAIYIGIAYDKTEQIESGNPNDYKWSRIKGEEGESAFTVILDNENVTFITDANNMPIENQSYILKLTVYKGIEIINNFKIIESELVAPEGLSLKVDNKLHQITVNCITSKKIAQNYDSINIPILIFDTIRFNKVLTYTLNKNGEITGYTWIKYAVDNHPASDAMKDVTSPLMEYIGVAYNKESPEESTNYQDYEWIKMNTKGSGEIQYEQIYYKSPYNELSEIPLPGEEANILNVSQGLISTDQGLVSFGLGQWADTEPEYQSGYFLWTALKLTMDDGTVLYTTPILSTKWNDKEKIGGAQLIRNSKTLIDERIYWF